MKYELEKYTALYSDLDWEYNNVMSGPYQNLSFRCDEGTIIAGMKDDVISGAWRPMVCVGSDKFQKLHIERLFDTCRNFYYMDFLIDGKLSVISQFLLRHGHKARPYYTQIIDLSKPMHEGLRKSYRSLVNKTTGIVPDTIEGYKEVHRFNKGITRPTRTWEIQKRMAIICNTRSNAGAMFYYNNFGGYYFSSAGENNHAIVYSLLRRLQERGCVYAEMGEQVFSGDPKLVNISKFKRGFGGRTTTRLILEKDTK